MNEASVQAGIEPRGDGHFAVNGPVVMSTAGRLLQASRALFPANADLQIDLSGVTRVDSAALALLIEWLRQARQHNVKLSIEGIPDKLHSIAQLSGVEKLIGSTHREASG